MNDNDEQTRPMSEEWSAWCDLPFMRFAADSTLESAWSPWPPATADDAFQHHESHLCGVYYALSLIQHERENGWRAPSGFHDPDTLLIVCEAIVRQPFSRSCWIRLSA
jgi:hypothetical protein